MTPTLTLKRETSHLLLTIFFHCPLPLGEVKKPLFFFDPPYKGDEICVHLYIFFQTLEKLEDFSALNILYAHLHLASFSLCSFFCCFFFFPLHYKGNIQVQISGL